MAVQLILLKSGEELIADVREIIDKETHKQMSLVFVRPVRLTITQKNVLNEDTNVTENVLNFEPWISTSKDESFFVPYEWVVTVTQPKDDILNSYVQNIGVKEDGQGDFIEDGSVFDSGD